MGYAPAVAARLGLGFASDVIGARAATARGRRDAAPTATRCAAELEFPGKAGTSCCCCGRTFRPRRRAAARRPARAVAVDLGAASRAAARRVREAAAGDVDITKADFLLSIGRGVGEQDNIARFEELAEKLGATLGVSRPLVDAGWMPSARQVGQSGQDRQAEGSISRSGSPAPSSTSPG